MDEKKSSRHRSLSARSFERRAIFSSNVNVVFDATAYSIFSSIYRSRRRRCRRRDISKRPRTRRVRYEETLAGWPGKTLDHLAASNENTNFPFSASVSRLDIRPCLPTSTRVVPFVLPIDRKQFPKQKLRGIVSNPANNSDLISPIDLSIRRRPI